MNADSYRDFLRSVLRENMTPTLDELLEGVPVNDLGMNRLELYVETVTGVDPRILEPAGYIPRPDKRRPA